MPGRGRAVRAADQLLRRFSGRWRQRRKYDAELAYWLGELRNLHAWFIEGSLDWWGLPPPTKAQKRHRAGSAWQTDALLTMHAMRPTYHEELLLPADAFNGKRVLEVGCGPLVPLLQFDGCNRHALDPLANLYMRAGWPLFDYDVTVVSDFAERMPYPDDYFDAVVSVNALDHVDDFDRVAAEILRVTRGGGSIHFEVEYHAPTVTEPLALDDARVRSAFRGIALDKVADRGKAELFRRLSERFALDERRFAGLGNEERFVLWRGVKAA